MISQYATNHGFEVVRTFSDEARSGLDLRHRPALRQLLAEVMGGQASFRIILVFDVSRWGRFQDADEAAHYEYVCKSAGIPIYYCAEQFSNVGGISDSLLKTLKRFMAGEFSRDLSARVSGALNNIVGRGFKYGSVPGYGLRRMLIGRNGQPKQLLAPGELKNITSDRVVFVPGPPEEQEVVREIYRMFVYQRQSIKQIARDLTARKVPWTTGSGWSVDAVKRILRHPKYIGTLVFNRTEKKLHAKQRPTSKDSWVVVPNAFQEIVNTELFAEAQKRFAKFPKHKSDTQLIDDLKRLLANRGKLSLPLMRDTQIRQSLGISCLATYFNRFGTLNEIYQRAGFELPATFKFRARTNTQRKQLMQDLLRCFPDELAVIEGRDKYLIFRKRRRVVIRICRASKNKNGDRRWTLGGCDGRSIVVAAILNEANDEAEAVYVLPAVATGRYWFGAESALLNSGIRLNQLADFATAAQTVARIPLNARRAIGTKC